MPYFFHGRLLAVTSVYLFCCALITYLKITCYKQQLILALINTSIKNQSAKTSQCIKNYIEVIKGKASQQQAYHQYFQK